MDEKKSLTPFVYWAQDDDCLHLRIDLRNTEKPSIEVDEQSVRFSSIGDGAGGRHEYCFFLQLHDKINTENVSEMVNSSHVQFVLRKQQPEWWPRLHSLTYAKPSWLRIDFDKWKDPAADEDSENFPANNFDMKSFEKQEAERLVKELSKDFDIYGHKDFRFSYLLIYNIAMFLGYLFINLELLRGFVDIGDEYLPKAYATTSSKMICCQLAQFLEVAHALIGYVRSGWLAPFLQTSGRGIILFGLIGAEPRLQEKPVVFYLFLIWSLIEVVRYPYYVFSILKTEKLKSLQSVITWLRYSMWIPLYPLGILCEGVLVIRAIPYFSETQRFSFHMPNYFNVGFDFSLFLHAYLALGVLPGFLYLMTYMARQRSKRIGKESRTLKKFKKLK